MTKRQRGRMTRPNGGRHRGPTKWLPEAPRGFAQVEDLGDLIPRERTPDSTEKALSKRDVNDGSVSARIGDRVDVLDGSGQLTGIRQKRRGARGNRHVVDNVLVQKRSSNSCDDRVDRIKSSLNWIRYWTSSQTFG